jgi:hypothetical protein
MIRKACLIALAAALAAPAAAHEVWVERDATGPARIYLGEPADPVPPGGDPEFHNLKSPKLVGAPPAAVALTRRADHIEAPVAGGGDVRVRDDAVFAPWKMGEAMQGGIFYARAGRSETAGRMDLELVPVVANGDSFTLMFRGKPLPATKLTVITPDRWQKAFVTDAAGRITVPQQGAGRYLVSASHTEQAPATLGGQPVASVVHISTLTFVR